MSYIVSIIWDGAPGTPVKEQIKDLQYAHVAQYCLIMKAKGDSETRYIPLARLREVRIRSSGDAA